MADIVISEFMDKAAVGRLCSFHDTFYDPELVDNPELLMKSVKGARALIVRNRTSVSKSVLDAGSDLIVVGRLGVGLDNIDVEECQNLAIEVIPATGANDLSVAEYVITSAHALLRGAFLSTFEVAEGVWPRQNLIGREISGKTMGLMGFGAIAREVASRAQALGVKVIAYDPYVNADEFVALGVDPVSLESLASNSDFLSLHVPLTEATRHAVDAKFLGSMKPDAVVINAARGGVVDEDALAHALSTGKLGGAALDVFETEPLTAHAGAKFKSLPNLILTPHIAGVTEESNVRVSNLIADKILDKLAE